MSYIVPGCIVKEGCTQSICGPLDEIPWNSREVQEGGKSLEKAKEPLCSNVLAQKSRCGACEGNRSAILVYAKALASEEDCFTGINLQLPGTTTIWSIMDTGAADNIRRLEAELGIDIYPGTEVL